MPITEFVVIVGVPEGTANSEPVAVADASRYLAYADHTDTFGYSSNIFDVMVHGGSRKSNTQYDCAVSLFFDALIENDEQLKEFMNEMVVLSRVETVEITGGERTTRL